MENLGLNNIDKISKILEKILPNKIGYVLLKCGTLVMINPESVSKVVKGEENAIFPDLGEDKWDYPEHRFNIQENLDQVVRMNQEYIREFLASKSTQEKIYFQLALRYMNNCGYAYPGGERSDRNVDTPIPIDGLIKNYKLDAEEFKNERDFIICSWPTCPGLFNHYICANDDPKLNLQTASGILSDLHRYDFIWPRFHSMRVPVLDNGAEEDDIELLD